MITVNFLLDRFYVKPKPEMKLKMLYKWISKIGFHKIYFEQFCSLFKYGGSIVVQIQS
jgi:hypothetical protein